MSLSDYFRSQADWRQSKAEEFPDDPRNAQSARALYSLAEYVEPDEAGRCEVPALVDQLTPHLFEGFDLGGEETQRAVARYGFGYHVTPTSHVEFLEELVVLCFEDAYEYARQHGDDPTGTLLPFEVDAAWRDVTLAPAYFRRRPKSLERELEEWVESSVVAEGKS